MSKSTKKINFTASCISEIIAEYALGSSFLDISIKHGCAKNTIRKYLILNGVIPNRGRSISFKNKGKPSPRKGVEWTNETRSKFMESSKKRKSWGGHTGIYDETRRQKMRDAWARNRSIRLPLLKKASVIAANKNRLTDEERFLRNKQRSRYKGCFRRFIRATGKKKCSKTEEALGYSQKQFVGHIENQFKPGMSWYDRESFHVDHKVPVAEFFRRGITDPRIICALDNLQPLYPQENRVKSDKLLTIYRSNEGKMVTVLGLEEIPI